MAWHPWKSRLTGGIQMKLMTLGLVLILGLGAGGYFALRANRTIFELLTQNRALRQAITNLTQQRQIGYAKVLSQETRNGVICTQLLFVVTDPENQNRRVLERKYEIQGDVIFFDALVVRFDTKVVMDGKEKALYLWRRVYGENMAPENGFAIEQPGEEPAQYQELFKKLSLHDRKLFWEEIGKLSNDPARLQSVGVQAVYGSAIYKKLQPGLIYIFNLDASGAFYPETVPAL